jgi:bacillithiol system protein YtxJ
MNELIELRTAEDLDRLLDAAGSTPVLIYKHSLTCGRSEMAFDEVRDLMRGPFLGAQVALVNVQLARALSDEIEARFGVRHESPQAILIQDGRVVWRASHLRVTAEGIAAALANAGAVRG